MSNSVVKVTDSTENDSLLMLIGEDGTVTPDRETVESFLKSKSGSTKIQVMHINKTDSKGIDVSVDNFTYVPDHKSNNSETSQPMAADKLAHLLYCIRLDHDYTTLTTPKRPEPSLDEELAQTLSILEGTDTGEIEPLVVTTISAPTKTPKIVKTIPKSTTPKKTFIAITPSSIPSTSKIIVTSASTVIKSSLVQSAFIRPALVQPPPVQTALVEPAKVTPPPPAPPPPPPLAPTAPPSQLVMEEPSPALHIVAPKAKAKAKIITTQKQPKPVARSKKVKQRIFEEIEDESDHGDDNIEKDLDESFDDEEFNLEYEDDENDSDFEIEQAQKLKIPKRGTRRQVKSESKTPRGRKLSTGTGKVKTEKQPEKVAEKEAEAVAASIPPSKTEAEKAPEETPAPTPGDEKLAQSAQSEQKQPEKKQPKKEKKPPKPIPDDFALFSTPDIIRRVGGKEPTTPVTPTSANSNFNTTTSAASLLSPTPADSPTKPGKITSENRSKSTSENLSSPVKHNRLSVDGKLLESKSPDKHPNHHRTHSESKHKDRRLSVESKSKRISLDESKLQRSSSERRKSMDHAVKPSPSQVSSSDSLGQINPEDMSDLMNESDKSFQQGLSNVMSGGSQQGIDQGNINLDNTSLDIDQSLLDNLNNDLISEDILYQVAQSLVANTELQNAIDKSLNEGNLVLDPSIQQAMESSTPNSVTPAPSNANSVNQTHTESPQKGTQIVRPDGRIVVIPPIERPTTRSRNKKKEEDKTPLKVTHKPLDEEHVSGNELDSSGVEDEEESEDDPNKLWCICNQPHNNRFMICCDTCEEWYHGKCVNITKAMGQQMEAEGKEWICLFCKDNSLKRPQAAARRIRKASRASRASSDSAGSSKKSNSEGTSSAASVPCIVCQKQSRKNSIFCSETCILAHAQGVEKVVVFERSSGTMLTGNRAPTAANLDQWLKEHPGYEVVRSTGKVTPSKSPQLTQSKLKLVKNVDNKGISLAVQKKGISVGVLKHSPKNRDTPQLKTAVKGQLSNAKPTHKNVNLIQQKLRPEVLHTNASKSPAGQSVSPHGNKPKSPRVIVVHKPGTPAKTPTKTPVVTPVKETKPANKEKPVPVKTPRARQSETTTQPKKQENIRENVQKTLLEQLSNRLKMVDDLKVTEEELRGISDEIESQLFKCFGDTGQKYRNKYRSLIFNIKDVKNQTLWRRICQKSVNPYQLVRLSSDDLASQELALWREREAKHQLDMIKKSELELLNCNRQYVLKTHKGEQVLEDARPSDRIDTAEVITSLTEGSKSETGDPKHDKDHDRKAKHGHKDRERELRKSAKDKDVKRKRSTSRDNDKKRSRSKDHGHHSAKKRSRSRDRDRHRKSSHKSSRHKKDYISSTDKLDKKSKEILEQLVDNKIVPPLEDRLWKHVPQDDIIPASIAESDSDHEPTSTVTIPTPPRNSEADDFQATTPPGGKAFEKRQDVGDSEERSTSPPLPRKSTDEIWRGTINMIDVAQISITAHEVSGDCTGLGTELPYNLDIVGRIAPDTVWDYIGKMKCSNSKIISMVRLNATNIEEKMPYLALYSYLSSRNRLGVVKAMNKAIKDFYILPLASQKPIPQALLPISGPGFEESRPALLLGVIVRDKRKRPMIDVLSTPPLNAPKRTRVETPPLPVQVSEPPRSYTPPPSKDPRLKLPLPPVVPAIPTTPLPVKGDDDGDEPYSPEDSDLDSSTTVTTPPLPASVPVIPPLQPPPPLPPSLGVTEAKPFDTFSVMEDMPGELDVSAASTKDIETHLAEINKKIAESKSEINSISQNLASTDIRSASLANIALPSNLQQILDSIKTIVPPAAETTPQVTPTEPVEESNTIPLMLPNKFSRPLTVMPPCVDLTSGIPLKLPKGKKTSMMNSPLLPDSDKSGGVLSSLSEEDLIKKAAEMLGEESEESKKDPDVVCLPDTSIPPPILPGLMAQPTIVKTLIPDSATKRMNFDLTQPPIPGLEDELS